MKITKGADNYYRCNVPTGAKTKNGKPVYKSLRAKTVAILFQKIKKYNESLSYNKNAIELTVDEFFCILVGTCKR